MYLSKHQLSRVRTVRREVIFENLPAPHAHTLIHSGIHQVVAWAETDGPVVGLVLISLDGARFVSSDLESEALRADIAGVLGVEPLAMEWTGLAGAGDLTEAELDEAIVAGVEAARELYAVFRDRERRNALRGQVKGPEERKRRRRSPGS